MRGPCRRPSSRRYRPADEVHVSAASAWEIAIKSALGKLRLSDSVADIAALYGFSSLPISLPHCEVVASLPQHHADPFDRMLTAQALAEGLTLVTKDKVIKRYPVPTLWAR